MDKIKQAFRYLLARLGESGTWAGIAAATATVPEYQPFTVACGVVAVLLRERGA